MDRWTWGAACGPRSRAISRRAERRGPGAGLRLPGRDRQRMGSFRGAISRDAASRGACAGARRAPRAGPRRLAVCRALWSRRTRRPAPLAAGLFSRTQLIAYLAERRSSRSASSTTIERIGAPRRSEKQPRANSHSRRWRRPAILRNPTARATSRRWARRSQRRWPSSSRAVRIAAQLLPSRRTHAERNWWHHGRV